MACLDMSALLDLIGRGGKRRQRTLLELLDRLVADGEALTTTRLTMAELWIGVERSSDRQREEAKVLHALGLFSMLEFDETAAKLYGRIQAALYGAGTPIGDMDALIAAIAISHGQTLVTRNTAHFDRVKALRVQTY
jgi:tRNA(fMet)-specific endonuclease VapC